MAYGTIVKALAGFYYVKTDSGVFMCRARGIFKKDEITPLVGDRARIAIQDGEEGVVEEILPRRNAFARPPVANVDAFACVVSLRDPPPNAEILDRFLLTAEMGGADAVILANKTDLDDGGELFRAIAEVYGGLYPTIGVSARAGYNIEAARRALSGMAVAFAGASGVGKSSLINMLVPAAGMETGEVSAKTGRGRQTTRHLEIIEDGRGLTVIDTPGFTSFEPAGPPGERPDRYYPDFGPWLGRCRFADCRHIDEPGCAVKAAVEAGSISRSRYGSYRKAVEASADRNRQKGQLHGKAFPIDP